MQTRPEEEFLAAAQICCVLLLKNMLYTNNNRFSSTIPPYWLIKSFHSTVRMYFCPQKMASEVPRPRSQDVYTGYIMACTPGRNLIMHLVLKQTFDWHYSKLLSQCHCICPLPVPMSMHPRTGSTLTLLNNLQTAIAIFFPGLDGMPLPTT